MKNLFKKKLILVLTLIFLSGCATTSVDQVVENSPQELENQNLVFIGQSKKEFCWARTSIWYAVMCYKYDALGKQPFMYYENKNYEVLASKFDRYYVFKNVTVKYTNLNNIGNGTLDKVFYSMDEAKSYVDTKLGIAKKPKKKKKSTSSNNESQGSSGSAFFISSKGDIITNNHVIEGCRSQPKVKYNNKDVTANIVATDKMLDLALLKADLRNTKYISFSKDEPKKLQRIIVAGYPFGQYISDDLKFTSGIVSSLKGPGDDSSLVQVDAALNVGNSGGPIVDESSGQLVAVSVLTMDKSIAEGQNFGIKTSSVKNFLNANKVKVPFGFNFNRDVADSLEKSTLYVYCY